MRVATPLLLVCEMPLMLGGSLEESLFKTLLADLVAKLKGSSSIVRKQKIFMLLI